MTDLHLVKKKNNNKGSYKQYFMIYLVNLSI